MCAGGGIRTHEAEAVELKSTPFDRSGTLAEVVCVCVLTEGVEPSTTAS